MVQIFAIFAGMLVNAKVKTVEISANELLNVKMTLSLFQERNKSLPSASSTAPWDNQRAMCKYKERTEKISFAVSVEAMVKTLQG